VPIPRALAAELAARDPGNHPDGSVIGQRPLTIMGQLRSRYLPRACAAARVPDDAGGERPVPRFSPHAIRRLASDELIRAGVDLGTYAELMGHSPKVALEHYRKASPADRRDAVTRAGLGDLGDGGAASSEETGELVVLPRRPRSR
jgi:integrase